MTTHNHTIPDRSPPGSTGTAPSAVHQDGGVKYATGASWKIRGRDNITIVTWNTRALRAAGKLQELAHEMDRYRWNILGLQFYQPLLRNIYTNTLNTRPRMKGVCFRVYYTCVQLLLFLQLYCPIIISLMGNSGLLSPGKASSDRFALLNLRCMLGVLVFPKSIEL